MAVTAEAAIMEALFARLATLTLTPVHPIAWPNLSFSKPGSNRYLEARFVPNTVTRRFIGSGDPQQHIGFLQVNVRDGQNQGSRVVETAGLVAAHFSTDLQLPHATGVSVRITSKPEVAAPIVENNPAGILVPVMIPYECWA